MHSPGHSFLPDFCAIRMVFAVVVTAQLLAFVLTLGGYAPEQDFWPELSLRSLYIQWVALSVTALLCLLRVPLARRGHTVVGVIAWLLVLTITAVVFAVSLWIGAPWEQDVWRALAHQLAIAGIVGAVVLRYLYEQHCQRERELAEARARFAALQARIRPHFLFNSMNTIANLTRIDARLAEQVVQDLSDLFRATLQDGNRLATLGEELELARGYLRIEGQRLGERLRVHWHLEDNLPSQAVMPGLLLQPLLENAVYHGVEPAPAGGDIEVDIRARRGLINLCVRNSLPDDGAASTRDGNHMALDNIRERLAVAFGDAAGIRIGAVDGRYQVRLFFPLRVEDVI